MPGAAVVTLLFTDVVGSTELLGRMGDDAAEQLLRSHFRMLRDVAATHRGETVKSLGDGVMVVFPSAVDAVSCAVAIQRAVQRSNHGSPDPIAVRVGLHVGEPIADEADYFGTPVVTAKRLCDAASGGQILASRLVAELVGSRGSHRFVDRGAVALKGFREAMDTCEVDWEPAPLAAAPVPAALATYTGDFFVGRDAVFRRLTSVWKEATVEGKRTVLVAGEPGVGKTRLASELAGIVSAEGGVVLYGRCEEDLGAPYQPFVEALREYVAVTPPGEDLLDRLGPHAGELVRLLPELGDGRSGLPPPTEADSETERYLLFEAIVAFFANASRARPVLFVVDDLHWAAKPTVLLLRHLVASSVSMAALVLGTYRDTELEPGQPLSTLVGDLPRLPGAVRLSLSGLDEDGVAAYVEAAAGHTLGERGHGLAVTLHAETAGNPFFIGELLAHLAESGAIYQRDGRWTADVDANAVDLDLPAGVREVIACRLARLPEDAQRALTVGAVAGPVFSMTLLERVAEAGTSSESMLAGLEDAARAGVVREVPPLDWSFSHALVRQTVYSQLSAARRCRLHRSVARALETLPGQPDATRIAQLAHHFGMAAPLGDAASALRYAREAGDIARAGLAFDEAAGYYERAIAALDLCEADDPPARCDLRIARGEVLRRAGDPAFRPVLMEAAALARSLGDTTRLGEAALAFTHWVHSSTVGGIDAELIGMLDEALIGLGAEDSALRARLLALLAVELTFTPDHERREALARESCEIATRMADPQVLTKTLPRAAWVMTGSPDVPDAAAAMTEQLVSLARDGSDEEAQLFGHYFEMNLAMKRGDLAVATAAHAEADRLAERLRQPAHRWNVEILRGALALLRGDLEEAERLVASACEIGQIADLPESLAMATFGGQLYWLRYDQGRLAELEGLMAAAVDAQPGLPAWRASLALIQCSEERFDEAAEQFEVAASNDFTDVPRDFVWVSATMMLADIACALGDGARGQLLFELLRPHAGFFGWNTLASTGPVDLRLGKVAALLGRTDEADSHLRAADEQCDLFGAPLWRARAVAERARLAGG